MSIATPEISPAEPSAPARRTLWGLSAAEVHDAYWGSMGVRVARPGMAAALQRDGGLYLLVGSGEMVLLDFRKVLNVMGWLAPRLCLVRPRIPTPDPAPNFLVALSAMALREFREGLSMTNWLAGLSRLVPPKVPMPDPAADGLLNGQLLRCAFTPALDMALSWCADDGTPAAWRRLERRIPGGSYCVARPKGRLYSESAAHRFLERLAQIWMDPTPGVPGLIKLGRGVFGLEKGAPGRLRGPGEKRHFWLGRGRSPREIAQGGSMCVLLDAGERRVIMA